MTHSLANQSSLSGSAGTKTKRKPVVVEVEDDDEPETAVPVKRQRIAEIIDLTDL